MPNWGWIALGLAIGWIIMTDDVPQVVPATGMQPDRMADQMPRNDLPARVSGVDNMTVRFQAPAGDTIAQPQQIYGKGYGNQIGGNYYQPLASSSDLATMGVLGSLNQGGILGRGYNG